MTPRARPDRIWLLRQREHEMRRTRALRRLLLVALGLIPLQFAGCLAAVQREIEVLFAPEVMQNALYIPESILFKILMPLLR